MNISSWLEGNRSVNLVGWSLTNKRSRKIGMPQLLKPGHLGYLGWWWNGETFYTSHKYATWVYYQDTFFALLFFHTSLLELPHKLCIPIIKNVLHLTIWQNPAAQANFFFLMVCNFDKVVTHNFSNLQQQSFLVKVEMMSILTLYLIFSILKGWRKPVKNQFWRWTNGKQCRALKNNSRMTGKELITIWVPNYTQWTKKNLHF